MEALAPNRNMIVIVAGAGSRRAPRADHPCSTLQPGLQSADTITRVVISSVSEAIQMFQRLCLMHRRTPPRNDGIRGKLAGRMPFTTLFEAITSVQAKDVDLTAT